MVWYFDREKPASIHFFVWPDAAVREGLAFQIEFVAVAPNRENVAMTARLR
jgi:hypothetical protein